MSDRKENHVRYEKLIETYSIKVFASGYYGGKVPLHSISFGKILLDESKFNFDQIVGDILGHWYGSLSLKDHKILNG